MDIDLITDPNLIPKPRNEIKIADLTATVLDSGTRIRIDIMLTPFAPADRPNIEVTAFNPQGNACSSFNVVETMHHSLSLTMHLPSHDPLPGTYRLQADLFFEEGQIQHSATAVVEIPGSSTNTP